MRADLPDPQVDRGGASGGHRQLAGSTSVARPGRLYWRRLTRCPPRRAIAAPGGITHQAPRICNLTGVMGLLPVGCWLTTDDSRCTTSRLANSPSPYRLSDSVNTRTRPLGPGTCGKGKGFGFEKRWAWGGLAGFLTLSTSSC